MYPESGFSRRQKGIGLPAALFVIVVLALLAVAITELERTTAEGVSINVQSMRAFYAAESGAQAALVQLFPVDTSDPANAADPSSCPSLSAISFTTAGLNGCSVQLSCAEDEAGGEDHFTLRSTGTCGSGADAAVRVVEVRAR